MHELDDDCLRGLLSLASWLINLEAPKVFPLKLGEGKHHDGRKREIEETSELNNTSAKTSSLKLFSHDDGNIRHLFYKIEKVRINIHRDESQDKASHAYSWKSKHTSHGIHKTITNIQGSTYFKQHLGNKMK